MAIGPPAFQMASSFPPSPKELDRLAAFYESHPPEFGHLIGAWSASSDIGMTGSDKQTILDDIRTHCLEKIAPASRANRYIVDVGGGDGVLLSPLAVEYEKAVGIDTYSDNRISILQRFQAQGLPPEKLIWMEGDLSQQAQLLQGSRFRGKVGTLLNIHNLYYLVYSPNAQAKMSTLLHEIVPVLAEGGNAMTVLKAPDKGASSALYDYFHQQKFELDLVRAAQEVKAQPPGIDLLHLEREIEVITDSLHRAFCCALLILLHYDEVPAFNFHGRFREILGYIEHHFWNADRKAYVIKQVQHHVVFQKHL